MNNGNADGRGWQVGRSILSANQYMFENQLSVDVYFDVCYSETSTRIGAHKYVLMSRSPVFEAMFCGDMVENTTDSNKTVSISDIDVDSFKETLRFIYCEKVCLSFQNVCSILYASKKYFLPDLTTQCKEFLERNIEVDNVCVIIDQSITYDEHELTKKCLEFIGPRAQVVFKTEGFLNLTQSALAKIIDCDHLYVESESWLFKECLRWAKHHELSHYHNASLDSDQGKSPEDSRVRKILGNIVFKIRYLLMDPIEFAKEVGKENILSDKEKSLLYYHILTHESLPCNSAFQQSNRVNICSRFTLIGSAPQWWSCNGPTDAVTFYTDTDIELVGVVLYGGKTACQHQVYTEICLVGESADDLTMLATVNRIIDSDGSSSPWPVYLPSPVHIQSKLMHTILVTMKGPLTHYGTYGKETVTRCGVNFNFSSSPKSTNGTNVKSGQIPQLVFMKKI